MKKLIAMIPTGGRKKEDIIKDATKAINDYKNSIKNSESDVAKSTDGMQVILFRKTPKYSKKIK